MSEEQGERFISEMDEYIKVDGTSGIKRRPSGTGIQKINPQDFLGVDNKQIKLTRWRSFSI